MKKRMTLSLTALALAVWLCFSLCSCVTGVSAAELSAGYSRNTTDNGKADDDFYAAMTALSFRLLGRSLDPDGKNTLISPYSIAMCLSMMTNGAEDETKAQLEALLGMDIDTLNRAMYASAMSLTGSESPLSTANSIWFRDSGSLHVEPSFLQTNADWYGAQVYASPFDDSTVKDINNWCGKYTDGMIKKIIDEIDPATVMYLINAVCFDAEWEEKYESNDIRDMTFTNRDGTTSTVKMMMSEEKIALSYENAKGFAKGYKGGRFSFVGLLPDDKSADIYEFAASLDGEAWLEMWRGRGAGAIVGIPEFKFDYKIKLNDVLGEMGVQDMFDGSKADFTRLGQCNDGNIYCSRVEHQTFIEVNRHGTKAAAITFGEMNAESAEPTPPIILDRPFVCGIVDNATGMPIFFGVVTNIG